MGAFRRKADFGEPEEEDAKNGTGVFLGFEAGIGAELVGGIPEALIEGGVVGILFGGGNPIHGSARRVFQAVSTAITIRLEGRGQGERRMQVDEATGLPNMRLVPITNFAVPGLMAATLAPLAPLLLTVIPSEDLLKKLSSVLFSVQ